MLSRIMFRAALLLVVVPMAGIFLASALGSDTLGWLSGFSLMATLPLAMLLSAVATLIVLMRKRGRSQAPAQAQPVAHAGTLLVRIERDCVHASDEMESRNLMVGASTTLAGLVEQVRRMGFLPGISGGAATWVVESSGNQPAAVGVLAQQWSAPAFVVPAQTLLGGHFAGREARLYFRYCRQEDPDLVLSQLVAN